MDHALSPLPSAHDAPALSVDARARWLQWSRGALRLLSTWPARARAVGARVRSHAPQSAFTPAMSVIEPPDLNGVIGRLLYPGRPGTVVRLAPEMLGTDLMAAYPWSREHGWTASN